MTVQDILNMDEKTFDALTESDLRKVTGRLVSAGNRRLRTFQKTGESSAAYRSVMESGGAFSIKGKSRAAVVAEFQRARSFFGKQTSTVKGARYVEKKIQETLSNKGVNIPKDEFTRMFRAFNKLRKASPKAKNLPSDVLLKKVNQYVKDHPRRGVERIATDIYKELDKIYEEWQRTNRDANVDGFYTIEPPANN